jgi:hypothetical protein
VTYGGDSGNRIFVLYWRCPLISVSVIRGSTVYIHAHLRLDGPGIESLWGQDFPYPFRPAPETQPASYTMGTGSSSRGYGTDNKPSSSADVKERVELYL